MMRLLTAFACLAAATSCGKVTESSQNADAAPVILDDAGQPIDCRIDRDCGLPVPGEFGLCDYEDACDEAAEQTRMVATPRCDNDICVLRMIPETQECTRDQEGAVCQDDGQICGSPVACHTCQSGVCAQNAADYNDMCEPDCREMGRLCGGPGPSGICCEPPEFSCPGGGDSKFDCDDCCFEMCEFDFPPF